MVEGVAQPYAQRLQRAALRPRVFTTVVGIPLVFLALWAGGLWWVGLMAAVAVIAWTEFIRLHPAGAMPAGPAIGVVMLLLTAGVFVFIMMRTGFVAYALFVAWLIIIAAAMVRYLWHQRSGSFAWMLHPVVLGPLYLGVPAAVLARWRLEASWWPVIAFLLVIWVNDIAAYFAGVAAGRHKMAPRISPGKSWEGAVAGLMAGAAAGAAGGGWLGVTPVIGAVFGSVTTIFSQGGDLLESAMKRQAGVKDSGTLLPGHGGMLDRLGGLLVAAPIAYILSRVWAG